MCPFLFSTELISYEIYLQDKYYCGCLGGGLLVSLLSSCKIFLPFFSMLLTCLITNMSLMECVILLTVT
ncbi:hypothetical protein GDO81_008701 [Engystomops pustulosus]|uniref:NADH dehydrogenase subunit 4L n=1 Tax=Engystomops pustulosus TaxID=76066 RepID=A0AAV7CGI9_ENGPU|nr:hypothetical protein GDO81_008701 [Engystomops pustulosus]